jgi:iron complex outermembrane receptor protein
MMIRTILFASLLLMNQMLAAQSLNLKGVVSDDKSSEKMPGVNVKNSHGKILGISDMNGSFTVNAELADQYILLTYLGYEAYKVELKAGMNTNIEVRLKETANLLDVVTVSGSRFEKKISEETVSISVIQPQQIAHAGITQIDDMLKRTPGVDVVDGQPNIRGGSGWSYGAGSRVMVLVDDLPMLSADAADVKWDFLPLENCEQVEVIKGASSALYGSSALNGAINFRTAFPRDKPQTQLNIQQGVYDTPANPNLKWWKNNFQKQNNISFFHSRKIKNFDMVVGGAFFSDDSYLQGGGNTRGRLNTNLRYRFKKVENLYVGLNANAQASKGALFFLWGVDDANLKYPNGTLRPDSNRYLIPRGGLDTPSTTLSYYNSYRFSLDPYITYDSKQGWKFKLRNRFFNTNNVNNSNQSSNAKLYYSEFQVQKKFFKQLNLTAGLVNNYSTVMSQLYADHYYQNMATYIQLDEKVGKRLWITAGGRYEYYKLDSVQALSKPLGRIGLNFQVHKATFLRASAGMGYRFPTIAEKFVNTSVSIVSIVPNPKLLPETGWNAEFGVKQLLSFKKLNAMIDVAAFYSEYKNMIDFVFDVFPGSKIPFGFQSQNITDARIKGIDGSIGFQWKIKKVNITANGGYTYTLPTDMKFDTLSVYSKSTRYSDTTQNILKYRYTTSAKGDIEIQWKKFTIGAYVRYNTYVVNIDPIFNTFFPSIKDYRARQAAKNIWVSDARFIYQLSETSSISFIVKNMFNEEYTERPAFMAPPRSFFIQYNYKF